MLNKRKKKNIITCLLTKFVSRLVVSTLQGARRLYLFLFNPVFLSKSHKHSFRILKIGIRLFFATYIITYLLTGINPFSFIYASFTSPNVKTINLYANSSELESAQSSYTEGWWNTYKAIGKPDIAEEADLEKFSEDNSAFYLGGNFSLILSNFVGDDEFYASIDDTASSSNKNTDYSQMNEVIASSSDTGLSNEVASTSIEVLEEVATNTPSDQIYGTSSPIIVIATGSPKIEVPEEVDANTEQSEPEIEMIDQEEEQVEIIEPEDTSADTSEVSSNWFEKIKDTSVAYLSTMFSGKSAEAEADLSGSTYPGIFKSASINFSFASKVINSENSDNSPSDDSEIPEYSNEAVEGFIEAGIDETVGSTSDEEKTEVISTDVVDEKTTEVIGNEGTEDSDAVTSENEAFVQMEEAPAEDEQEIEIVEPENDDRPVTVEEEQAEEPSVIEEESANNESEETNNEAEPAESPSTLDDIISRLKIQNANAQSETHIVIWYSLAPASTTEERFWEQLGVISDEEYSNAVNNGYYSYDAPFIESWEDIEGLQIKFQGVAGTDTVFVTYLDSLWVSVDYEDGTPTEEEIIYNEKMELLSKYLVFNVNEQGKLDFRYHKEGDSWFTELGDRLGFSSYWDNVDINITFIDPSGEEVDLPIVTIFGDDGELSVKWPEMPRMLKPGKYTIKFKIVDSSGDETKIFSYSQTFSWGVLAINFNKATYASNEEAYVQMAVLDEEGHTICNADLGLEITSPSGKTSYFSTEDGIVRNPECGPDNVIDSPDYYFYYQTAEEGTYEVELISTTTEGAKVIQDNFLVDSSLDFDVERTGPTRIYPWADYTMEIAVKAGEEFSGSVIEYVPNGFRIVSEEVLLKDAESSQYIDLKNPESTSTIPVEYELVNSEEVKTLVWKNIILEAGDEMRISYTFDAPNYSPELYLLGPLNLNNSTSSPDALDFDDHMVFTENRQWQVAADTDVRTIISQSIAVDSSTDTVNYKNAVIIPASSFTGGAKYFIYVTAGFAGSTNANLLNYKIDYNTSAQFTGTLEPSSGTAYDAHQISWFDVYDMPSTPVDVVLRYRPVTGAAYALNAQILAINLSDLTTADWAYNLNTTAVSHTTTPTARASVTLSNADSVKDWLVFAMEEVNIDSAGINYVGDIYNGTTAYMGQTMEAEDTTEVLSYALYCPFNDVPLNTTYRIRVSDDATAVNDHIKSRVFALNLDAFESHKTTYQNININLSTTPAWTAIGNLNSGGNYTPQTTGDQIIFASFINNAIGADDGVNDRLQVNGVTTPTNWSWVQSPVPNRTSYDLSDEIAQNILTKVSIPSTGQTINLDAIRVVADTQIADEVAMAVFSVKKKNRYNPTGDITDAVQRKDGSGIVDIGIEINDGDYDNSSAMIEFATGSSCVFSPSGDPTLDETDANTTATYGDPDVLNSQSYQIGTVSAPILTSSGLNAIDFDWQSQADAPMADGQYCLRLTANDGTVDQATPDTMLITLDNTSPSIAGPLALSSRTGETMTMILGATSTETNFKEYKIFYKLYDGTDPTEADSVLSSSTDLNLGDKLFLGATTATVSGLSASTTYSFAIWAYDDYGNRSSSTRVDITTNDAPTSEFTSAEQRYAGGGVVDISIEVDDLNNHDTLVGRLDYTAGADCVFEPPLDPTLDTNPANVFADFGLPAINNVNEYQIGASGAYILTSPGSNSIDFDWLSATDEEDADGEYCLRLTVNDRFDDQLVSATTSLTLDNVIPVSTGNLTIGEVTTESVQLIFDTAHPATDTNEPTTAAYKIFYKAGVSGVTEANTRYNNSALNAYDYNSATSTLVSGLISNTWYVFNIWTYDTFGNKISATEVSVKTNATLANTSLTLTNAEYDDANKVVLAGTSTEWNFRAVVTESNGWYSISSSTLRLANDADNTAPYNDIAFKWNQSTQVFSEIGTDVNNSVTLSPNSTSTCSTYSCTLDFKLLFNKDFALPNTIYSAELISNNDFGVSDTDIYTNFYQVRFPFISQVHYRWRNNNGGE